MQVGIVRANESLPVVHPIFIPCAYVVFNRHRQEVLPGLLQGLRQRGVISVGRYGAWEYASMEKALLDGIDRELIPVMQLDPIAGLESDAAQRCGLQRILPVLARRGEHHLDAAELRLQHDAEAHLGLAVADPALSWNRLSGLH